MSTPLCDIELVLDRRARPRLDILVTSPSRLPFRAVFGARSTNNASQHSRHIIYPPFKPQYGSLCIIFSLTVTMARQTTRPRKHGRAASPLVLRKSPRLPKKPTKVTVARSISPAIERQPVAKDGSKSKTKQTVSAAGVFKKQQKTDRRSKKHRKLREETPEPDLFEDLQGM